MYFEILLLLLVVFWLLKIRLTKAPKGLPPGEWGLPVIGTFPGFGMSMLDHISKMTNKYGKIFHMKVGSRIWVIISDYQLIKAAFGHPSLQSRPGFFSLSFFYKFENLGIIHSMEQVWQNNRRFALRHLRDFGFGKSSMDSIIQKEAEELVKDFTKTSGTAVELGWNVNVAALNVIWGLTAARRYEVDDPEIHKFVETMSLYIELMLGTVTTFDSFPWLAKLLPNFLKNKWMKLDQMTECRDAVYAFFRDAISEHSSTLDPSNPRDYIDCYLLEIEAQKGDPKSTFKQNRRDLEASLGDLFSAGSETTASTLRWIALYMALYPEVQKKAQEEIDSVVPRDRIPSLQDKNQLPYFEAVLLEVQRKASLVPVGLGHCVSEGFFINDYFFPKGTVVMGNTEAIHNDATYWEKPEQFYPQHFLDENGKVISKKEGFMPFSIGRRQCLGESLAKMELFLFASALLQKFSISAPPGETLSANSARDQLILQVTKPFRVIMNVRT